MKSQVSAVFAMMFCVVTFSVSGSLHAEEAVPSTLLLQAVVLDDGGNVIDSAIQESDFIFRIKDASGEILFTETQNVVVYNGMISALVGSQTSGGIPLESLAPDGDRILEFQMEGHSISQETFLLASAPYAYYAEAIAGGINSEDINDGQIELVDLSAEVQSLLTATDEDGEPLSSVDASDVTFSADIVNGTGSNMETLVQSIDGVISTQASQIDVIEAEVASLETSASGLESRVTTVETAVTGLDTRVTSIESGTALDSRYVNTSGDTMTGALTATSFTGNGSGLTNLNGSQISTGTVADARIASTIARDTEIITAHSGLSGLTSGDDHTQYLERDGSDTMTGDLQMNGNEIDGVGTWTDPVGSTLDNHETRITDLERDGDIEESELPEAVRPLAYGSCRKVGDSSTDDETDDLYNITGAKLGSRQDCDGMTSYTFTSAPTNTNYIVLISAHSHIDCYVSTKTTSGFVVECDSASDGYDYMVYWNPDF